MPKYSQYIIDEVSRRNNIVDIVSSYVKLKQNGMRHVGLCPFHKEKTPSFNVSEDKQLFYCFGCHESGNIFDFIMKMENMDFVDALKYLADRVNITLEAEETSSKEHEDFHKRKQRIYEMNKAAARFFVDSLFDKSAVIAHEYIKKRQLDRETVKRFGIGYAPDNWTGLLSYMTEKGYTEDELISACLASKSEKGRVHDFFVNRLMFPVIDVRGNVIAFSGRALSSDDNRKYVNSSETPVYTKGKNLFSLNLAKQYGMKNGLILVEGNLDVVSLSKNGFQNVVAPLGTAFTEEQAKILKRYACEVYLCFDSDEAGKKSTLRAIEILSQTQNKTKIISFSGAKDPDEYILKFGAESFRSCIANAKNATEYKVMQIRNNYDITEVSEKIAFVNEAADILSTVDNVVEREAFVKRISVETDISTDSIFAEINKRIYKQNKREVSKELNQANYRNTGKNSDNESSGVIKSEKMLLNILFFSKRALEYVRPMIDEEFFGRNEYKKIYQLICEHHRQVNETDVNIFVNSVDDEELRKKISEILFSEYECEPVTAARDIADKLLEEKEKLRIMKLSLEGDVNSINEILKKQIERKGKLG